MAGAGALAGRAAIVTGGARGIGAAVSALLAARGASVAVADNGASIDGRVQDPSVARDFAAGPGGSAAADWNAVIRNNLAGAYYPTAAATPAMRAQAKAGRGGADGPGWGRIVNVVSTAAWIGNYGQASYAAAKGGLAALTRVTALDMARAGVTCNAVAPFARSRVTEAIAPANDRQARYKDKALTVPADPVARFVGYLCAPAAHSVTGQFFGVRGREVFVFGQPRPAARAVAGPEGWDDDALAPAVDSGLRPHFAPLETDLEVFDTDPVL